MSICIVINVLTVYFIYLKEGIEGVCYKRKHLDQGRAGIQSETDLLELTQAFLLHVDLESPFSSTEFFGSCCPEYICRASVTGKVP